MKTEEWGPKRDSLKVGKSKRGGGRRGSGGVKSGSQKGLAICCSQGQDLRVMSICGSCR